MAANTRKPKNLQEKSARSTNERLTPPYKWEIALNLFCHFFDSTKKWIAYFCIGYFIILPALPELRTMLEVIMTAPEEKIRAFGSHVIAPFFTKEGMTPIIIAAVSWGISIILAIMWRLERSDNKRHIEKIDSLRRQLETNDQGGRTSSGLDKHGDRPTK